VRGGSFLLHVPEDGKCTFLGNYDIMVLDNP